MFLLLAVKLLFPALWCHVTVANRDRLTHLLFFFFFFTHCLSSLKHHLNINQFDHIEDQSGPQLCFPGSILLLRPSHTRGHYLPGEVTLQEGSFPCCHLLPGEGGASLGRSREACAEFSLQCFLWWDNLAHLALQSFLPHLQNGDHNPPCGPSEN